MKTNMHSMKLSSVLFFEDITAQTCNIQTLDIFQYS